MSPLLPLVAALVAGAPGDHPKLEAGVELYHSGDLKGSLSLLLEALDSGTPRQRATARLYIGLIQHQTGNTRDAGASFKHALELWPQIRPPRGTPKRTAEAFESVREKVAPDAPPPRSKPKREKKPPPPEERGPEVLQPLEGGVPSYGRDGHGDRRESPEDDPLSITDHGPIDREDRTVPVLGWVAVGTGAAAAIAGITLSILASVDAKRALQQEEKQRAESLHDRAGTQNKAALASFGTAGVLFGVAALTVTF